MFNAKMDGDFADIVARGKSLQKNWPDCPQGLKPLRAKGLNIGAEASTP
jgi:hypothetical protein